MATPNHKAVVKRSPQTRDALRTLHVELMGLRSLAIAAHAALRKSKDADTDDNSQAAQHVLWIIAGKADQLADIAEEAA